MADTFDIQTRAGSIERNLSSLEVAAAVRCRKQRAWLVATVLLTICAFIATVVMSPRQSATPLPALAGLLFLGSSVHVASTGWLFALPEVRAHAARNPARYIWVPVALIVATAITASLSSPSGLTWILLPYFCWQFFHFSKQNLGLASLAASSMGAPSLRPVERTSLIAAGLAGIAGLVSHPQLLQLQVNTGISRLFPLVVLTFAGSVGIGLTVLLRRPSRDRPKAFCIMYLVALLFSLPVFLFGSPYAAVGGMTVAHGFQYLLLVGLVATGAGRRSTRALRLALLCNIALIGGVLLSTASHLHSSGLVGRLLFGAYLGAVMAHFVIDAGLWRMRDAFPRAFMTSHLPYLMRAGAGPSETQSPDRSAADIR